MCVHSFGNIEYINVTTVGIIKYGETIRCGPGTNPVKGHDFIGRFLTNIPGFDVLYPHTNLATWVNMKLLCSHFLRFALNFLPEHENFQLG